MQTKVTVNSQLVEFGYELISTIPFAYWLYEHDRLEKTISGIGSSPFYYFSPDHLEVPGTRSWHNLPLLKTPNKFIHKPKLDKRYFSPPPYKEIYANKKYHFDLVIYNRYNAEWLEVPELNRPINFFDLTLLETIFSRFQGKILYVNVDGRKDLLDNAGAMPLGDWNIVKKYSNVTSIHDLEEDYNTAQLMAFSNCPLFLTTNGGGCILASYFGGRNIIYTNPQNIRGKIFPRENQMGDFAYYPSFGGSEIINVHTYKDIIKLIL